MKSVYAFFAGLSSWCTRSWHNTSNHRLWIYSASQWKSPFGRAKSITKRTMTYSLSYDISCVCIFYCYAFVAVLDVCTIGTTWQLLRLLWDARGLSGTSGVRCQSSARRCTLSSPRVLNLVSRLVVHEVPGGAARWRLCRFVFLNQQYSQVEPWTKKSPELEYIYPFFPSTSPFSFPPVLYTPTASWSRHHVTCPKQCLSFQNTPDNLYNFVCSFWASVHYVRLYHNANASDVDSFSTRSDGTNGQPQRKGECNC